MPRVRERGELMACYLCSDELDAASEACADCDAEFWADPVYVLEEPDG